MSKKTIKKLLRRVSWYPPYLGAGIKLKKVNKDFTRFEVEMKLRFYNRNLFGTHFGGSLYAMSDPFFVFIILNYLGQDYVVWDRSARIEFKKPGKGTVKGIFEISEDELKKIKAEVEVERKKIFVFKTEITNASEETVALIEKEIYVRKK
jgi:acyl-coenzyme A thioesterase PaaI-like protein